MHLNKAVHQKTYNPANKDNELSESFDESDDANTDEGDKTIEEDQMEVVNNESEPVNFIKPEIEQSVDQSTFSVEHDSGSFNREPPLTRMPRN